MMPRSVEAAEFVSERIHSSAMPLPNYGSNGGPAAPIVRRATIKEAAA